MLSDGASTHWQIIAELPYVDLEPAYEQVRRMRHVLYKPFDATVDDHVRFSYRGYEFRIIRCADHLDILVNDPECPTEVLLEPLTQLIPPLSRCSLKHE